MVNGSIFQYAIRLGVPQDSLLSPALFIAFIDELLNALESMIDIRAFADDIFISDDSLSCGPSLSHIQQALDIFDHWREHWGLNFKASKCKALDIS